MSVQVRDRGANALLRAAKSLAKGPAVDVGVIGSAAAQEESTGITVAMVAEWAEFGLGQPMRSWLRAWIDGNARDISERIKQESADVLAGKRNQAQALERLGAWAVGQIRDRIANGIDPPNAEATIARKGSSTPLIDKGQLRSSIASRVVR